MNDSGITTANENSETVKRKRILSKALTEIQSLKEQLKVAKMEIQNTLTASHVSTAEKSTNLNVDTRIAVVGVGCRLPGGINSPESFWTNLCAGFDAITTRNYGQDAQGNDVVGEGAYLDDITHFDPAFFGIAPREAQGMDPQQRIFLEVAWEALENANATGDRLAAERCGVFVGVTGRDYADLQMRSMSSSAFDQRTITGTIPAFIAGRLSHCLGLQGPAIAVDTACSSSLVSVHLAKQSLLSGECDVALAGGVNVLAAPLWNDILNHAQMLSPRSRCHTFDHKADGYVRGEGCVVFTLKRYEDAKKDKDNIWGIIRGSAVNHDGHASGLTVPSSDAQVSVIRTALQDANLTPSDINYIETHGTGTPLGDPIEVEALTEAYQAKRQTPFFLGALKSNIGHLEPAAGAAGLLKTLLVARHGIVPPNLHCDQLNENISLDKLNALLPDKLHYLEGHSFNEHDLQGSKHNQRFTAVSSFGASGTNVHMVVEGVEANCIESEQTGISVTKQPWSVLILSAQNEQALKETCSRWQEFLQSTDRPLSEICIIALKGRKLLRHRLAVIADSKAHMVQRLTDIISAGFSKEVYFQGRPIENIPSSMPAAFLFPGQGSHYPKMGIDLYRADPAFKAWVQECATLVEFSKIPLISIMRGESSELLASRIDWLHVVLFVVEAGMAKLWQKKYGQPEAVLGHSLGEVAAAYISGVFNLEDALALVVARGQLMESLPKVGGMLALKADVGTAKKLIHRYPEISIAALNAPGQTVVSGYLSTLEQVESDAKSQGVHCRFLPVANAYHSAIMDAMLAEFKQKVARLKFNEPSIPFISSLYGKSSNCFTERQTPITHPDYWVKQVREPVNFQGALAELEQLGVECTLEMGPANALSRMAEICTPKAPRLVISGLDSRENEQKSIVRMLAESYLYGLHSSSMWESFYGETAISSYVPLPCYPFQRLHFWLPDLEDLTNANDALHFSGNVNPLTSLPIVHPLLGVKVNTPAASIYESQVSLGSLPFMRDFCVRSDYVVNIGVYLGAWVAAAKLNSTLNNDDILITLDSLSLTKACILTEKTQALQLIMSDCKSSGEIQFFTRSDESDVHVDDKLNAATWSKLCSGKWSSEPVKLSSTLQSTMEPLLDASLHARHPDLTGQQVYSDMADRGITLGPAGRWIDTAWRYEEKVICQLRKPLQEEVVAENEWPPGLVDALFQCFYADLCAQNRENPELNQNKKLGIFMLMSIGKTVIRPHCIPAWCQVDIQHGKGSGASQQVRGNITCWDSEGNYCATIEDVLLRLVEQGQLKKNDNSTIKTIQPSSERISATTLNKGILGETQKLIATVLGFTQAQDCSIDIPLLDLGLDSILAIEVKEHLSKELSIQVDLADLLDSPTIQELLSEYAPERLAEDALQHENSNCEPGSVEAIAEKSAPTNSSVLKNSLESKNLESSSLSNHSSSFPLTDLQQAYLVGRGSVINLGKIPTCFFLELRLPGLDLDKLERSWNVLIRRHNMLRAVFDEENGTQKVLEKTPFFHFNRVPIPSGGNIDDVIHSTRISMQSPSGDATRWPLFDIRVIAYDDDLRFFFNIDALIIDAWSTAIIFREWSNLYRDMDAALPPIEYEFSDYIHDLELFKKSEKYQKDYQYWNERVQSLPPAPSLPLAIRPESLDTPVFKRFSARIPQQIWQDFKSLARQQKVTATVALCAAFSQILSVWSNTQAMTLNVLFFNRHNFNEDVNSIVANFSSTMLLGLEFKPGQTFIDKAKEVRKQMSACMEHSAVSGVEVNRMLNRHNGGSFSANMPIVFASTLNMSRDEDGASSGLSTPLVELANDNAEQVSSAIRTPQVWLDHQVLEDNEGGILNWDVVEGLFPLGLVESMLNAYVSLVTHLAQDKEVWQNDMSRGLLNDEDLKARREANSIKQNFPVSLIHEPVIAQALANPDAPALIGEGYQYSYAEMLGAVDRTASALLKKSLKPQQCVAICLEKGWQQVVAALAILRCGAIYVPIDPSLPETRINFILNDIDSAAIITTSRLAQSAAWCSTCPLITIDKSPSKYRGKANFPEPISLNSLAYIIYTSGSTGQPKGVAMEHAAVSNTLIDINKRCDVNEKTRCFALSSLSFDLSVYDIFGVLGAGGAMVFPAQNKERDPIHWLEQSRNHHVTLWNSVPALVQLFSDSLLEHEESWPSALQRVMMSGDWIPVGLPDQIWSLDSNVSIESLGGATEAAIWSIHYPVNSVEPSWDSIPYGKPLANQKFHVLDQSLQPSPVWVSGDLYIAGDGLARLYWNREELSRERFFSHPETGERLYMTGDTGRYLPDGNIEFQGRVDNQVKIQGYRIELGEIESALVALEGIEQAIVIAKGEATQGKSLVAFYVMNHSVMSSIPIESKPSEIQAYPDLKTVLHECLPSYMLPSVFVPLLKLPLSSNGKVDRKALHEYDLSYISSHKKEHDQKILSPSQTLLAQSILTIWEKVLPQDNISIDDDFFALGGNSLMAVRLLSQMNHQLDAGFILADIIEKPTIKQLTLAYSSKDSSQESKISIVSSSATLPQMICLQKGNDFDLPLILIHPVGGGVMCYRELVNALDYSGAIYGIQAVGLQRNEMPLQSIKAMADCYLNVIEKAFPSLSFHLAGWSLGGVVALEMCSQSSVRGYQPATLTTIDSRLDHGYSKPSKGLPEYKLSINNFVNDLLRSQNSENIFDLSDVKGEGRATYAKAMHEYLIAQDQLDEAIGFETFMQLFNVHSSGMAALKEFVATPLDMSVMSILADEGVCDVSARTLWKKTMGQTLSLISVSGDHYSIMYAPYVVTVADYFRSSLNEHCNDLKAPVAFNE